MVSGASGWDRGRTEQGRTMVKFGRPWDAPGPCVSEGTEDPIRAPLKWQEAQRRHVTCFTKLPNRGMADLVWDVLGGAAEAPVQWLGSFSTQKDCFPGDASQGYFQNFTGDGARSIIPTLPRGQLKPKESLAGHGCGAES